MEPLVNLHFPKYLLFLTKSNPGPSQGDNDGDKWKRKPH